MIAVYTLPAGCMEKIAVDEAVFWNTIAATLHLSTCNATPMSNIKCHWTQKEYMVPLWESLNNLTSYLLQISNSSLVKNSIWNWFLSVQIIWAPFLRPLYITMIWTWNSKYNYRNLHPPSPFPSFLIKNSWISCNESAFQVNEMRKNWVSQI